MEGKAFEHCATEEAETGVGRGDEERVARLAVTSLASSVDEAVSECRPGELAGCTLHTMGSPHASLPGGEEGHHAGDWDRV